MVRVLQGYAQGYILQDRNPWSATVDDSFWPLHFTWSVRLHEATSFEFSHVTSADLKHEAAVAYLDPDFHCVVAMGAPVITGAPVHTGSPVSTGHRWCASFRGCASCHGCASRMTRYSVIRFSRQACIVTPIRLAILNAADNGITVRTGHDLRHPLQPAVP